MVPLLFLNHPLQKQLKKGIVIPLDTDFFRFKDSYDD